MKVKSLYKLLDKQCEIVILNGDNPEVPIYRGLKDNMPAYLLFLDIVNIDPLGDDGYNRLLITL